MVIENKKIVHVHIPRTGGSSFYRMINAEEKDITYRYIKNNIQEGHYTASEIKKCIGDDKFDKFFKISFVRNPWDRIISLYEVRDGRLLGVSKTTNNFEYYLSDLKEKFDNMRDYSHPDFCHYISMCEYLTNKSDDLLVDYVGRFENFNSDIKVIFDKLGYGNVPQKHVYKSNRKENYKDYYNNKTIKIVGDLYHNDLIKFNYKYE